DTDLWDIPVTVKRDWVEDKNNNRDRFIQDGVIVEELFKSMSNFTRFEVFWVDHFLHDLVDLLKRPRPTPLCAVVAIRLFVDIQRTLPDAGLVQGFSQMIRTVQTPDRWCECNLTSHTDRVSLRDAQEPLSDGLAFAAFAKELLDLEGFRRVLARWPVWCGLFVFV